MRRAGEQVAGVIIQPVQDLHVGAVDQAPVDEVRLPHLVRLSHLEPRVGRSGPLARLRGDQPGLLQDPADRRRRRRLVTFLLQMPADRVRSGIQSVSGQLRSQLDHPHANLLRRRDRCRPRAARARLERSKASCSVAGQEAVQMPAGEPVLGSSRGDRQLLGHDLENSNTRSGHARDCPPTPGQATPGDRRCGVALRAPPPRRPPQPQAPTPPPGETYVPTHEGPITWDICREPTHPRSPSRKPCSCYRVLRSRQIRGGTTSATSLASGTRPRGCGAAADGGAWRACAARHCGDRRVPSERRLDRGREDFFENNS